MPNNPSVIARPTESGFAGRYVHNDGHPSQRLPLLLALHFSAFGGDVERMAAFLIDEHPAGWSQLGADPTADTGFISRYPSTMAAVEDRGFRCYCHGDRGEAARLVTERTGDPDLDGWVYVLLAEGVQVWAPKPSRKGWRPEAPVPWLDDPSDIDSHSGEQRFTAAELAAARDDVAFLDAEFPDESDVPTGQLYPSQIGVFCDGCGTTVEHDYVVSDLMDQAQRFEVAREHLRRNEGWQCDEAGDFCPGCKPAAVSDARAAEDVAR